MPNFRSKEGFLQRFSKAAQAARKVQGSITFDPGTRLEKKLNSHLGVHIHTLLKNSVNIRTKLTS